MDDITLQQALDAARKAWPQIRVEPAVFRRYLKKVLGAAPRPDWQRYAADLYIACACASGDAAAQEALEREHRPALEAAIRRIDADPEVMAEALRLLRSTVLSRNGKVLGFAARGSLAAWLSICSARLALNAIRRRHWSSISSSEAPSSSHQN